MSGTNEGENRSGMAIGGVPAASPSGRAGPAIRSFAVAAGLALFLAGGACGYGAALWAPTWSGDQAVEAEPPDAWRDTIAVAFALTTSQTLTAFVRDRSTIDRDLAAVGKQIDLELPREKVELPGQTIRRIELFHASGALVAQVAYFNPEAGPVALCVLGRSQAPEPVVSERRRGMNVAYWSTPRHAYMLVGRAPDEMLTEFARKLAPELGP